MDKELIKEAIRNSDLVQLDETGNKVRANSKRLMLLVRGIPEGTSHEVSPTLHTAQSSTYPQHVIPAQCHHAVYCTHACCPFHCLLCFRFSVYFSGIATFIHCLPCLSRTLWLSFVMGIARRALAVSRLAVTHGTSTLTAKKMHRRLA